MRTQFLGQAYASDSLPLAAQTRINLFFEAAPQGSAYDGMLYGAPGRVLFCTLGDGPIRGMAYAGSKRWAVSGETLYSIDASGTGTSVTTIAGTGRCMLVANDTQLVVMHESGWTVITLATDAVSTPANAPLTAQGTYQDSYIVFPNANGTYGWTAIGNATSIGALDFASAEAQPDPIVAVLSDHRELWLFGRDTVEIAQTSGNADLVFTRTAIMEQGCIARYSPAKADNTVIWLGGNHHGKGRVYKADGYTPVGVSDAALDTWLDAIDDLSDAFAFTYKQGGHTFYVLTVPGHGSWAYDLSGGGWSQLAYRNPMTGDLEQIRDNAYCFDGSRHLVGDYENGNIYELRLDAYTDNGDPIYRERAWSVIQAGGKFIRHSRGELFGEMGVGLASGQGEDPVALLSWSRDGCRTWSNDRELHLGRIGQYKNRAYTWRVGLGRETVYRLRMTDPVKVRWYGFEIEATTGTR